MTVVFTNGVFDLLHAGHVRLLQFAATYGELVVGINSDASVKRIKGPRRPINSQQDRVAVIRALRCVARVDVFDEDTPLRLIELLCPDILVKGPDYQGRTLVGEEFVVGRGGQVIVPPWPVDVSTTSLIRRIQDLYKPWS